jgi:tRNA threonylcarbamoyladenosine biosynthesis protein TsaE
MVSKQFQLELAEVAQTEQLGALLAEIASPGMVVFLRGDLGAGKTTLVRGFLRSLGFTGAVKSPTYTILEPYAVGGMHIAHLDLYRLTDAEELDYIGLRELLDGQSVLLIEWPDRGAGALPRAQIDLTLSHRGEGRCVELVVDRHHERIAAIGQWQQRIAGTLA